MHAKYKKESLKNEFRPEISKHLPDIALEIMRIFIRYNMSIEECRSTLDYAQAELDEVIPWQRNQASKENSQ